MKTILFNLHDLVLVAIMGVCGLLAVLCLKGQRQQLKPWPLFAFLTLNGLIALDTLVFWGEGVKYFAFEMAPWSLTFFSFASFAVGPVLYWFIRSEFAGNYRLHWQHYLHLIPTFATFVYLYWVCYQHPIDIQRDLVLNLTLYSVPSAHFTSFITLKTLLPAIYCLYSLTFLNNKYNQFNNTPSLVNGKHLLYFASGFAFVRIWILITHLLSSWLPLIICDYMGIIGNYLMFALLTSFALTVLRPSKPPRSLLALNVDNDPTLRDDPDKSIAPKEFDPGSPIAEDLEVVATLIQTYMDQSKPYLNPRLTLDRFAEQLNTPARQVSNAINRVFQQNVQEYINHHRIEEAKRLLADDQSAELIISDVAKLSGFNSKATFNRLFKLYTSFSPSQYRLHYQPNFSQQYSSN